MNLRISDGDRPCLRNFWQESAAGWRSGTSPTWSWGARHSPVRRARLTRDIDVNHRHKFVPRPRVDGRDGEPGLGIEVPHHGRGTSGVRPRYFCPSLPGRNIGHTGGFHNIPIVLGEASPREGQDGPDSRLGVRLAALEDVLSSRRKPKDRGTWKTP